MTTATQTYYPIFLDLRGRCCVVVGGGEVAERKVGLLLECGAQVRVVSPELTPRLKEQADQGKFQVIPRPFQPQDLEGAFMAIAATSQVGVNQQVASSAQSRNMLVNVADDPSQGNFIVPSVVRRGDLVIAISTSGHSPALARKLRQELEKSFGPEYASLLALVSSVRRQLQSQGQSPSPQAWQEALDTELLELVRQGDKETARARLLARLQAREGVL